MIHLFHNWTKWHDIMSEETRAHIARDGIPYFVQQKKVCTVCGKERGREVLVE